MEQVSQLGQLITERQKFWAEAIQRKDLLGANLRGLKNTRFGIPTDMSPIENPVIPALLHLTDWYRKNQPAQTAQVVEKIKSTFPEGAIRTTLADWNWVADHHPVSLLKNGNFESTSVSTTDVQPDWNTKNIPGGWASWSRYHFAKFTKEAERNGSIAVRISTPTDRAESGRLVQNINNLTPGGRYLAVAWVKMEPGFDPNGISLGLRLRADGNWYPADKGPVIVQTAAAPTGEWQQMIVSITLPQDANGLSLQLDASKSAAVFDDVALYKIPADDSLLMK